MDRRRALLVGEEDSNTMWKCWAWIKSLINACDDGLWLAALQLQGQAGCKAGN